MEDYLQGFITLKNIIISDEIAGEYILELLCLSNIAAEHGITSAVAERDQWLAGRYTLVGDDTAGQATEANTDSADQVDDQRNEKSDQVLKAGSPVFKPDTVMISSDAFMLKIASEHGVATVGVYPPGDEPDMDLKCDILVEGMENVDVCFLDRISKRKEKRPWITAVTKRTYLREMTLSDLDRLYEIYAEDGMTDYTEDLYEIDEEKEYIKHYIDNIYFFYGYGMWLVCLRDSGRVIGRAGIEQRTVGDETLLEIGYLISREYQHQGYASEVIDELIKFTSENLTDFDTLNVFIRPGNEASINLIKSKGFVVGGYGDGDTTELLRYTYKLR